MSVDTEPKSPEVEDIETLGRRLGEAITGLPVYERFEDVQSRVKADDEVQEQIQSFEQLRHEFMLSRQAGEATEQDLRELQAAQRELHSIQVMSEFIEAQEELQERLKEINEAISEPLAIDFGGEAGGCCQD